MANVKFVKVVAVITLLLMNVAVGSDKPGRGGFLTTVISGVTGTFTVGLNVASQGGTIRSEVHFQ